MPDTVVRVGRRWGLAAVTATALACAPRGLPHDDFVLSDSIAVPDSPTTLLAADLDGDGDQDLAVASQNVSLEILLGDGEGRFEVRQRFQAGGLYPSLAAGDFDGDGVPDLLVGSIDSQAVTLLHGEGRGTFTARTVRPMLQGVTAMAARDLDGDGLLDVAAAATTIATTDSTTLVLWRGAGDGNFIDAARYRSGVQALAVAFADVDRDGRVDLLVSGAAAYSNDHPGAYLRVLPGRGGFAFGREIASPMGGQRWTDAWPTLAVADFDSDGTPDVALGIGSACDGWCSWSAMALLGGSPDFTFTPTHGYPIDARSVVSADFDGDGIPDLAASHAGGVAVFRGHGAGAFLEMSNVSLDGALGLATADFDGDGRPDLAVAGYRSDRVSILLGRIR